MRRSTFCFWAAASLGVVACSVRERPFGADAGGTGGTGGGSSQGGDGGQGGDGATPDETPPVVVNASPQGLLIDGRAPVIVEFDEDVEATADAVSVTLDSVVTIAGTAEVDGRRLIFRPEEPFNQLGTYSVEVAARAVSDLRGNSLDAAYGFEFTSAESEEGPTSVRLDIGEAKGATCPHLLMDEQGNATVLFQKAGTLYTARYDAGLGWRDTEELSVGADGVLAVSRGGRVAVAYTAEIAGVPRTLVRVSASVTDPTLGAPLLADENATHPLKIAATCDLQQQNKAVAVNDDGAVAVVWRTETATGGDPIKGMTMNVKSSAGDFGDTPVFTSQQPAVTWTKAPAVGIDDEGSVEVLIEGAGAFGDEYAQRRYDGTTWSSATAVETQSSGAARIGWGADGRFYFALAPYDTNTRVLVRSAEFAGTNAGTPFNTVVGGPAIPLFLSVSGAAPWFTWVANGNIGVAGLFGSNWDADVSLANDSELANPVVAGVDGTQASVTRGLVVWERNSALRWARVTGAMLGLEIDASGAMPTEGSDGTSPRVVYDIPGRHGIVVWIRDDEQLRATHFHRIPPAIP